MFDPGNFHAHYRGVRARLMRKPRPAPVEPEPKPVLEGPAPLPPPGPDAPWLRAPVMTRRAMALQIIAEVGERYGVSVDDILGPSQKKKFAEPRHAAIRAVRQEFPHFSLMHLGQIFHRDHTTILHAIRKGAE